MSQIYNGSFVLGDTSATTLSAGPGIKLDTSVPGAIGISNDETLLYSGAYSTSTTAVNLSEEITNFDKIEVWWIQQNARPLVNQYQTENLSQIFTIHGKCENNNAVVFFVGWNKGTDNKSFSKYFCKYKPTNDWTNLADANEVVPVKILGINRKEV